MTTAPRSGHTSERERSAVRRRVPAAERANARLAHLRETLRTGLWFVPGIFVVGAALLSILTVTLDHRRTGLPGWLLFTGGPTSALQILSTIAASMMTFTGLVFTITVVVLQLASSQFSPRVLRTFLRDRGSQVSLGVFTATFVYALIVLVQVRTGSVGPVFVPRLSVSVSFGLVLASLVAFVYLVDHVAQSIRVVNIIETVAAQTREAIDDLHPEAYDAADGAAGDVELGTQRRVIALERHGGVLAGLDIEGLVGLARRHDCLLRLVRNVGDYVVEGGPLVEVYDGGDVLTCEQVLRQVDIARERTMRQDAAFGFRQLADIGEKALSPAVNDPTTAVQAIDRLHDLLARLAGRALDPGVYEDDEGRVRLVREVQSWSGYVTLAFEEIREYGGTSIQVHRRLRAALVELLSMVPAQRRPPLERQLRLLEQSAGRFFPEPEERALAEVSDESGLDNVKDPAGPDPTDRPGSLARQRRRSGDGR